MNEQPPRPLPLDYAPPPRPTRTWADLAGIMLGVVAGSFGAVVLAFGVTGVVLVMAEFRAGSTDPSGGVYGLILSLVGLGLLCVWVGIRWVRAGFRGNFRDVRP